MLTTADAPWSHVAHALAEALPGVSTTVFARFDPEPLAAASIAQVHAARPATNAPSGTRWVARPHR